MRHLFEESGDAGANDAQELGTNMHGAMRLTGGKAS